MKKIAHIFNSIEYSGAERMIFSLQEFYNAEFIPYAISTGIKKGEFYNEFSEKFKCFHIPVTTKRNYNYIINLFELIHFYRKEKIEIVHIHPSRRFIFHVIASKFGGVKKVVRQVHNNFEFEGVVKIKEIISRKFAKLFSVDIVSISTTVFQNELNRFYNKTVIINNFYDDEIIFPGSQSEKRNIRKDLGIVESAFVLISIGTCCDRKQHKHIIEAVSLLKHKIPNIFYLHLGEGEDEEDEKAFCKKLNILNDVMFAGNVSDVRNYLVASDIYLITSKIEGLSIATIEAMGVAIPVILYNTPGSLDFGINGAPGILTESNIKSLEEKICEMHSSKGDLNTIAKSSLEFASGSFSKKQAIINWKNIYFDKKN